MKPVSPVIPGSESVELVVGKSQKECVPLPSFRTEIACISRWKMTNEERAHIANGGDIFTAQLNFGGQVQPVIPLAVGEDEVLPIVLAMEEDFLKRSRG